MRDNIIRIIKVLLACVLVFLVAAPVIVGVYDAANIRTDRISKATVGSIVEQSGVDGRSGYTYNSTESGLDGSTHYGQSGASLHDQEAKQVSYPVADWYSGDPAASDLLGSGDASLTYKFNDGSTVDFGNPYVLDWSDVPQPDDYDQVVYGDDGESSLFAPEKAYAGPISWLTGKLKYLAVKSGYWKSFNSMMYSAAITICMTSGMNYTAATQCVNKVVAELPAITRVITSESAVFTTEDTAMLVSNSIARVAARNVAAKDFPAALNAEIAANVTAVETTGMLAGGASGNFVNAMYQLAATGGVPASILFSDFGLYIGSWLGGQFDSFEDLNLGAPETSEGTLTFGDHNYYFKFANSAEMLGGRNVNGDLSGYMPVLRDWYTSFGTRYQFLVCVPSDSSVTYNLYVSVSDNLEFMPYEISIDGGTFKSLTVDMDSSNAWSVSSSTSSIRNSSIQAIYNSYGADFQFLLSSDVTWNIYDTDKTTLIAQLDHGVYTGDLPWTGSNGDSPQTFPGQVIGSDAQYDEAGHVVNSGNVTVPNVTSPDYVAPNTFFDALNQMNATATMDKPAHADSPAFGQDGTTVKDWTDANKPADPVPSDDKRDAFRIEDLKTVFPFCIPWDLYYLLASFTADPVAPNFDWTFDFGEAGRHVFHVDLAQFETVAQVLRTCEIVSFCIGLALITRNVIRG